MRCPPRGRCACGPAKPVPRPVLEWDVGAIQAPAYASSLSATTVASTFHCV